MAKYKLENKTRHRVFLKVHDRVTPPGGRRPILGKSRIVLTLGDSADTDDAVARCGVRVRGPLCPSPVAIVTDEDLEAMGEANRAFLDGEVAAGRIVRTQLAA